MTDTIAAALIAGGSSVAVSITALLLNYRGFSSLERRMDALDTRMNALDGRMTTLESVLRVYGERLARLEERTPPLIHR
jgi:hypothetical protein